MDENRPGPRPWSAETITVCPVDLPVQAWIEASMRWFAEQFGEEAVLRDVALPVPSFLPADYSGTADQIEALVFRIRDLMSVDPARRVVVRLFDGSSSTAARRAERRAVGHYHEENGQAVISLDLRETTDPAHLTAIIAHELCHVRLLGENRISATRTDHEHLTDLLTVYLGFGIFTANAALSFTETADGWSVQPRGYLSEKDLNGAHNDGYARLGYLTEAEFGYALACYCRLRGEDDPAWAAHLDPGPRQFLKQGLAYLVRSGPGTFPTLRRGVGRMSIEVVPRMRSSGVSFLIMVRGFEQRLLPRPTWPIATSVPPTPEPDPTGPLPVNQPIN